MTSPLPNKCDLCGLRVFHAFRSSGETISSDEAFGRLHALKERRIISKSNVPARVVGMSNIQGDFGSTAFCAVTSKAWQRNDKRCKHWALRIEGASVADYLSLYQARRSSRSAIWLGIAAIVIAVAVAVVQAVV